MTRPGYLFTTIQGTLWACDHPEGQDPLLLTWRSGNVATHPRWTDPAFWERVTQALGRIERGIAQNRAKRHAAKKDD